LSNNPAFFISSVKWQPRASGLRRMANLWNYISPDPASFDPHFRSVTGFYVERKPWKNVTPQFMQSVMYWWHIELEWEGKPVPKKSFAVGIKPEISSDFYRNTRLTARLQGYYPPGLIAHYDTYLTGRKPWKRMTEAHLKLAIESLGGRVL
jgi:hypothetical protein